VLRGNHRQPIFFGPDDYARFEVVLCDALERYDAKLLAYCWMTNHVHLAVRVAEAPLGAVIRVVASRYARWLQQSVPTTGHLFERRYWARLVEADRYLAALVRYIHLNPVRAAMVADPRDYRWSSHCAYLRVRPCPGWLCVDPVLEAFGASPEAARDAYQRFMSVTPSAEELEQLRIRVRAGRPESTREAATVPPACDGRAVPARTLELIAAAVAGEYGVRVPDLQSPRRDAVLVEARAEVARRALRAGVATLEQVARHLGRAPSTFSRLLNRRDGRPR
jgi:REP element-mobilizing transposase RayT